MRKVVHSPVVVVLVWNTRLVRRESGHVSTGGVGEPERLCDTGKVTSVVENATPSAGGQVVCDMTEQRTQSVSPAYNCASGSAGRGHPLLHLVLHGG